MAQIPQSPFLLLAWELSEVESLPWMAWLGALRHALWGGCSSVGRGSPGGLSALVASPLSALQSLARIRPWPTVAC